MTKIGDVARMLGVTLNTVKNWMDRYESYFSQGALKQGVSQRVFTEDDILTLATIATLRGDNLDFDVIGNRLESGYRVENPGVANFGVDMRLIPAAAVEQMIDASELRLELEQIRFERDRLLEERKEDKAEIQRLNNRVIELTHSLGRAEGELELRRKQDKKSDD